MTMSIDRSNIHFGCIILLLAVAASLQICGHVGGSAIPVELETAGQTDGRKYLDKNELLSVPLDMIDINRFDEGDLDDLQRELRDQSPAPSQSVANQTADVISIALLGDASKNDTIIVGQLKKEELGQRPEFEYKTIKKKN